MDVSRTQAKPMTEIQRIEATHAEQKRLQPNRDQKTPEQVAQAKPQPVINTQGQTTGRLLNVTA